MSALLGSLFLGVGIAAYTPIEPPKPGYCWNYDICHTKNPYGTLELGSQWDYSHGVHLEFVLRHASSIATTQDHGINSAELRLRYSPFK